MGNPSLRLSEVLSQRRATGKLSVYPQEYQNTMEFTLQENAGPSCQQPARLTKFFFTSYEGTNNLKAVNILQAPWLNCNAIY